MKILILGLVAFLPCSVWSALRAQDPPPAPAPAAALAPAPAGEAAGWLGVRLARLPDALKAHLGLTDGAMVDDVLQGSPAEKAGLRLYDVIISAGGQPVKSLEELKDRIRAAKPGEVMKLEVRRGAESRAIDVTLGSAPAPQAAEKEEKREEVQQGFLGIAFNKVSPDLGSHLGLKEGVGVVVGDVWKGSPAEKAGIESKDVVTAVDGQEVHGPSGFLDLIGSKKPGDEVQIDFIHKGEKKSQKVALTAKPKELRDTGFSPRDRLFWTPRSSRHGKVILRSPDGQEQSLELPEALWNADDLFKELEGKLGEFKDSHLPQLKERLRKGLRELEEKLGDGDAESVLASPPGGIFSSTTFRSIEGPYDITLRDQNGVRTVTVLKDKKMVAENLPFEKIDTLPEDVRHPVKKAAQSFKAAPGGEPRSQSQEPRLIVPEGGPKVRA